MEKVLSVVIPVYNVEKYIQKCLDSLLIPDELLSFVDIVIVNDGTPDRSAEIAKTYESRYPEVFRVIDKDNGGHGSAWNRGIIEAKGKYLFFLDSDDWYDTAQFAKLVSSLKECDVDLVFLNWTKYYAYQNKEEVVRIINVLPVQIYNSDSFDWLNSGNGPHLTYATSTVYRTTMLRQFMPVFCEKVMYDDIILQVLPIVASHSFVYLDLNVYHYLIGRPGQSFDPIIRAKRANDVTIVLKQVLSFLKQNRNSIPEGSTQREWADFHYSAFATHHYNELSQFSYKVAKKKLTDWDQYVRTFLPDIELTNLVKFYRCVPFFMYYSYYIMKVMLNKVLLHLGLINKNRLGR